MANIRLAQIHLKACRHRAVRILRQEGTDKRCVRCLTVDFQELQGWRSFHANRHERLAVLLRPFRPRNAAGVEFCVDWGR